LGFSPRVKISKNEGGPGLPYYSNEKEERAQKVQENFKNYSLQVISFLNVFIRGDLYPVLALDSDYALILEKIP